MAQASLLELMEDVYEKVKDEKLFRRNVSDRKTHEFSFDIVDVKKQCMLEVEARSVRDLGEYTPELKRRFSSIFDKPIKQMGENFFNLMVPAGATAEATPKKIGKATYLVAANGTATKFTATISKSKEDQTPDLFQSFKQNIKQEGQRELNQAFFNEIDKYNKETKGKKLKKGQKFLVMGHEEDSAVGLQRQKTVQDMWFTFATKHPQVKGLMDKLADEHFLSVIKKEIGDIDTISFSLESNMINSRTADKGEIANLNKALKNAIEKLKATTWVDHESSDSYATKVEKRIIADLKKGLTGKNFTIKENKPGKIKKAPSGPTKGKKRKTKVSVIRAPKDTLKSPKGRKVKRKNILANNTQLLGILNQRLPETVRDNMQAPGLENQSGRFASSVKATDVNLTRKGFPSVGYTYDRQNYGQYEATSGSAQWASSERDPRQLIDKSIREIAAQAALGRFFTRRV
tara:strand:+ start:208 stop:1587 length:1380 start_codon:yes stop_codon:yes gene_type:complete